MAGKLTFLHAISSLHCGTGQGVGSIDLPIARERATNLPLVPGSTIKGCLRDALRTEMAPERWVQIFGPERVEADSAAGAVRVSDALLLLLPVRCLAGTFVWVTSPFLLHRLHRDAAAAGLTGLPAVPAVGEGEVALGSDDPLISLGGKRRLVLEELDFAGGTTAAAAAWAGWIATRLFGGAMQAWQAEFKIRFAIVDDKSFAYLSEFSTEVNAHIKMDPDKGTVAGGALWYQEALPAETVCYFLLQADVRTPRPLTTKEVLEAVQERSDIQFGGKASTGLGMARIVPVAGAL